MRKKITVLVFCFLVLGILSPIRVSAATEITLYDSEVYTLPPISSYQDLIIRVSAGANVTIRGQGFQTSGISIVCEGNNTVLLDNIRISNTQYLTGSPIEIIGNDTVLYFSGVNELLTDYDYAGIHVISPYDVTLVGQPDAVLTIESRYDGAGIGGNLSENGGTVFIEDLTVYIDSAYGAAIGGGFLADGGNVIIDESIIFARTGFAQEIGAGYLGDNNGSLFIVGSYAICTEHSISALGGSIFLSSPLPDPLYGIDLKDSWSSGNGYFYGQLSALSYYVNGSVSTPQPSAYYSPLGSAVVAAAPVAPAHYTFREWNTAINGSGTSYQPGDAIVLTGYTTLNAIWDPIRVESVSIVQFGGETLEISPSDAGTMSAIVLPSDALNADVTWTSSDPSVVSIDANGNYLAIAPGTATITATADGVSDTYDVKVIVPITSFDITETTLNLIDSETYTLEVTVLPNNATYADVTFQSSDESVATVDANGTITAQFPGTANIMATATNGWIDVCIVNVSKLDVETLDLNETEMELELDDIAMLEASVSPSNATYPEVTWTTSDKFIVSVTNYGKIHASGYGTATITAEADGVKSTCVVTVVKHVESITIDQSDVSVYLQDQITLNGTVLPVDATKQEISWSSSDPAIAEIDANGVVTAKKEGAVSITATADGQTGTCVVTVKRHAVTNVILNYNALSLFPGRSVALSASVVPSNATYLAVSWKSSNPAVATVSSNGTVTAVGVGTATIVATADGVSKTCSVTVKPVAVSSIEVDPEESSLLVGEQLQLHVSVKPADATERKVVWISSDENVASVDENGLVSAIGPGLVMINAQADGVSGACVIAVKERDPSPLSSTEVKIDYNTANGEVTITLSAEQIPDGASRIRLPDGTVIPISINESNELDIIFQDEQLDLNGQLIIEFLDENEVPLASGSFQVLESGSARVPKGWIYTVIGVILLGGVGGMRFLMKRKLKT